MNTIENIPATVAAQKEFFRSEATLDIKFRKAALHRLLDSVCKHENELYDALWQDLHKSREEAYLCETSIVKNEIRNHLKHLDRWARPRRVKSPLTHFPSSSHLVSEHCCLEACRNLCRAACLCAVTYHAADICERVGDGVANLFK